MIKNLQAVIIASGTKDWEILGKPMSAHVKGMAEKYADIISPQDISETVNSEGHLLILLDNMPLISDEVLSGILAEHSDKSNALTVLGSVYLVNSKLLLEIMQKAEITSLTQESISRIMGMLEEGWYRCAKYDASEDLRVHPIDNGAKLVQAVSFIRQRINKRLMEQNVIIMDPANTYIGPDVRIQGGSVIQPNTFLEGETVIGCDCTIGPCTTLKNMKIGDSVVISHSVLLDSEIGNHVTVGPYAYVRPNCKIGDKCKIGDFVEIKNSVIGNNTKASHLTYIGDADVGNNVNFGCGSVVVNYDGKYKHRTTIEDNAFIGCNTNLVAPVTVQNGAYTAAGSTITGDVPAHALAIARAKQVNKEDWHKK